RLSHNPAALPIAGATVPPGRTEQHSAGAAMAGSGGGAPTLAVKARRLWLRPGAGGKLRVPPRQFRQLRPPPLAVFAIGQDAELVRIIAIMRRPFRARPRIGPAMRAGAAPRRSSPGHMLSSRLDLPSQQTPLGCGNSSSAACDPFVSEKRDAVIPGCGT